MISNVLALTKTQLFPHDPDVDIQENLKPSQGSCTFSGQKFKVFSRTFQVPNYKFQGLFFMTILPQNQEKCLC